MAGMLRTKPHHVWQYVLIAIGFRLILEFAYTEFVSPIFDYAGLIISVNQEKYIESWAIYVAVLLIIPTKAKKPSDILVGLAFYIYITPLLVFYGLANPERFSMYLVLMQFIIMDLVRRYRLLSVPSFTGGYEGAKWISVAGMLIATAWMVATVGFSNFNLSDTAVYDFRDEANTAIYSGPMGYLTIWSTNICSSILLLIALRSKKYLWVAAIAVIHVVWFGLSTHKSVLFFPYLVAFVYLIIGRFRSTAIIPLGFSIITGLALVSFFLTEDVLLASLFIRRVFFVPSHLTFTYLEFFSNNSFVYWSNSVLSWLIPYPYRESVALVIGDHLGDQTLWANNSFFSTGFMHAGLLGIGLYGITAGVVLAVIDTFTRRGLPIQIILAVVIVPFYNLYTSADLTTSLLTHGLGFAILMLSFLSSSNARGRPSNIKASSG